MKLKKVLRMLGSAIYWFAFGWLAVSFLLGTGTTFSNIVIGIACVKMLLDIVRYVVPAIYHYRTYRMFMKLFYAMKKLHKARYELYFSPGREKEIEECTKEIKEGCNIIILGSCNLLEGKFLTKKQKERIKTMVEETKVLITKAQPAM